LNLAGRQAATAESLVESLHCLRVAVTVFDSAERLVFANDHFGYLFRSLPPRAELVGLSYEQLIRLEVAGGEIAAHEAADLSGFIARRRAQFRDGEYRPLDIALADGRIVEIKARRTQSGGWITLWTDVTAARHANTRLEDAVALTAEAFAFYDKNDRLAVCNDAYASFFGFADASGVIGRSFADLMNGAKTSPRIAHTEPPEEWLARRMEVHASPAGTMTIELSSGAAYLMRDRPTAEGGRVVVFTDVTDSRRVELAFAEQTRTLAETRSEAERQANYLSDLTRRFDEAAASADTAKTTLMRNMSHELKTPLNAIIGFSDLMLAMKGRLSEQQVQEYAALIHDGGRNLLRLINQILDLTKLSAGHYELHRGRIDASAALASVRMDYDARAADRNLALAVDAPPAMVIDADDNAFSSILSHLIDNALTYTQKGGAVTLSAARQDGFVCVRVADNGPGVDADEIARILKPFEQGGRSIVDHAAGAGLGLTLVKALTEALGGTLTIESAPGHGFCATVALPAAE
jgi:two-component system cell cycle sensor histidine kinase PleC